MPTQLLQLQHSHMPSSAPLPTANPPLDRQRTRAVLAIRLLHLAMLAGLHSNLEPVLADTAGTEPAWRTMGRLLQACRFVPMLISCLGFQLTPAASAAMQAASVAFVLQDARAACASPLMKQPGPQANLARCGQPVRGFSCAVVCPPCHWFMVLRSNGISCQTTCGCAVPMPVQTSLTLQNASIPAACSASWAPPAPRSHPPPCQPWTCHQGPTHACRSRCGCW